MHKVRPPAVAGTFYEKDPAILRRHIAALLDKAGQANKTVPRRIKALIAPHAGYIYSGTTAAAAYVSLEPQRESVSRVVLLGPAHRVAVRGFALPEANIFRTPLGDIEVDVKTAAKLSRLPNVVMSERAHALEHSLEVQLPFLQCLLPNFSLVPLAVGGAQAAEVAELINMFWHDENTLIVVSSDLSHFHHYHQARQLDQETVNQILSLQAQLTHDQACGGTPINGLLLAAQTHCATPELVDLRNSGDTAGDKNRVVGYASFTFAESEHEHRA